jgi:hypothetical protein
MALDSAYRLFRPVQLKPCGGGGNIRHSKRMRVMTGVPIQQMADRVAALMEQRLRVRGQGLREKLRKGGRLLPRRVRAAAEVLQTGASMAQNPKLWAQVDQQAVAQAYDTCVRHLNGVDGGDRRVAALMGIAASVAFSVLVVAALLFTVLRWRGFI